MALKPATDSHELLRQWEDVSAQRAGFQSVWQEIADHLLRRRDFTTTATPGRKRMVRIYDTTGLQAADLLSAALHSFLTNPALRWFSLRAEDAGLANDVAVHERDKAHECEMQNGGLLNSTQATIEAAGGTISQIVRAMRR